MPPITRNQVKKSSLKTEPYSKENRPTEKRTALLDIIENNGVKTVAIPTKEKLVNESNQIICKNINTEKSEIESKITQVQNELIKTTETNKPNTPPSIKESAHSSIEISRNSSLYQPVLEEKNDSKCSKESEILYITAEDAVDSTYNSNRFSLENNSGLYHSAVQEISVSSKKDDEEVFEIDKTNWSDFLYMGCYAREIFKYLKQREDLFDVTDYINNQSELTPKHRAIVVNWLVMLQDMYSLNHEVLYMAVKLIDLYLMKHDTMKDKFQLLASGAILISSKIDERELGFPYDLVKQSKYIYTEEELFDTEREIAKALNFDINVPLSYVFLRRYARCMRCQMFLLTLARYILECSLLDYKFVTFRGSLIAAASFYLAFQMSSKPVDPKEFYKYTEYSIKDVKDTVIALNNMLHNPQSSDLSAVKEKYSHEAFYNVASKKLLSCSQLNFEY